MRIAKAFAIISLFATGASAGQFAPPAGYSDGVHGPDVAKSVDADAPLLTRLPNASLDGLFRVDPRYSRADHAHVKVVGAFAVGVPRGVRLIDAWAPGYLPVTLSFSDGQCFSFSADYNDNALSNGKMTRSGCSDKREPDPAPPSPHNQALRLVGASWGYSAWADDRSGTTTITAPHSETFEPLFIAKMPIVAIMAMTGPDYPGGNITLVGRIRGQLTIVTLKESC